MRVHFIAIGGAVMHNMALAMHNLGNDVSGSDDQIFEPSRSRLEKKGLLPSEFGWFPEKISPEIDAIILGMHARKDNPELVKAQELGLKIYSFPEYVYENSKDKTRVVIAGSHGKTTITSMIMHVLNWCNKDFDYLVGSQLEGFDTMVKISDAPIIIIEGDEYLSSPLDMRSKFLWYKPHLAVVSGIAWDHINVFPTFESYLNTFEEFLKTFESNAKCFFSSNDTHLNSLAKRTCTNPTIDFYKALNYTVENEICYLLRESGKKVPLQIFGEHNMFNLNACFNICSNLGIIEDQFYEAIQHFKGSGKRLQLVKENSDSKVFIDFAHAPSKLKATINSVKEQYPSKKLIAIYELHTFSSVSEHFLGEYKGTTNKADELVIVYNPEVAEQKKMKVLSNERLLETFKHKNIHLFCKRESLEEYLRQLLLKNSIVLMMSSGNFFNLRPEELIKT
jgi:UDP-N-acetylmuramate: L-alanyl-gamma-D-glutamyl-meso-diaminopimelate ligase